MGVQVGSCEIGSLMRLVKYRRFNLVMQNRLSGLDIVIMDGWMVNELDGVELEEGNLVEDELGKDELDVAELIL